MKHLATIAATVLLALPASAQIFVAPGGDDSGPGSHEHPFATPARAQRAVREWRAANPDRGVTVQLRGGTYRLEAPLLLGPEDGGSETARVRWTSFPAERVVFSGGREIETWERKGQGVYVATIPETAAGGIAPRSLYRNGTRLPRARHPNSGWLRVDKAGKDRRTSFSFEAGTAPEIAEAAGLEVLLLHDWSTSRIPVAELDAAAGLLRTASPIGCSAPHYAIDNFEPHPRFILEGHRALMDAPGEWLLDPGTGELSLIHPEGPESPNGTPAVRGEDLWEYPVLEQLLRIEGRPGRPVRNLRFRGIDFEHCAFEQPAGGWAGAQASMYERRDGSERQGQRVFVPAAVSLEGAVNCSFTDSSFRHLDGTALWIGPGCRDVVLRECEISDVGANGLNIGDDGSSYVGDQPWWKVPESAPELLTQRITVENCLIERCGQLYGGAVGLWIGFAADCLIRNNDIRNLPYTGLSVGWVWAPDPSPCRGHRIERNHIHDVMQLLSDGGCIYTLGRQPGTVIRDNHLHGVPRHAGRAPSNGIFMDEGTTEILVQGNLIHGIGHSPIRFHRAQENTIRRNFLEVPEGLPPFYYNNTDADRIERIDNQLGPKIDPTARAQVAARAGRSPGLPVD